MDLWFQRSTYYKLWVNTNPNCDPNADIDVMMPFYTESYLTVPKKNSGLCQGLTM